jgi:very-short-patch-repair endonuclease
MTIRSLSGGDANLPPPERGRSVREANRVGVNAARFNRTPSKTTRARSLRRESTDVEMNLWQKLRNRQLGVDFRRQHPTGPYILDFYCASLCLAIELDGGQHNEHANERRDSKRDAWLAGRSVKTLRFWNSDVIGNLSGVLEAIKTAIEDRKTMKMTPTRRWRADLPLSWGGSERRGRI